MYGRILLCARSCPAPAALRLRGPALCTEEPVGGYRRSAVKGQKWFSINNCVCDKRDDEPSPSAASTAEKEEKEQQGAQGKAKENLLNLIAAMKVEKRSTKRFQALRMQKTMEHPQTEDEPPPSAVSTTKKETKEQQAAPEVAKENLMNLIAAMKVEMSSTKRFQALKEQKMIEHSQKEENSENVTSKFQKVTKDSERKRGTQLSPELVAAASSVATSLPFNKRQIESELLRQLRIHEEEAAQMRGDSPNISNIIGDMRIGKRPTGRFASRAADQIRFDEDGRGFIPERGVVYEYSGIRKMGLYTRKKLNIFPGSYTDAIETPGADSSPSLWDLELAKQIAEAGHQPPRNGFEEMIQWTKEGKLWEFPINNEAGLEEEQNVEFHEHIFLDKHLENFPKQGPIRHFMELVICGLSKNPYLTVKKKTEHIEWFRNYFQEKEDLLKECEVYLN